MHVMLVGLLAAIAAVVWTRGVVPVSAGQDLDVTAVTAREVGLVLAFAAVMMLLVVAAMALGA